MTISNAEQFVRDWVQAWNDRDIDSVSAFYAENVTYHSPKLEQVLSRPVSRLSSKADLIKYWELALQKAPTLYFEVDRFFTSSDAITLLFTNHSGQQVAETFIFNAEGKIQECVAAYR